MTTTHAARGAVIDRLIAALDIHPDDVIHVSTMQSSWDGHSTIQLRRRPASSDLAWEDLTVSLDKARIVREDLDIELIAPKEATA